MRRRNRDAAERRDDPERCREAALALLERSRRTGADLARRLREKGHADGVVGDVIARLTSVGLIDDAEYARAYIHGRWGRRAAGWRRIEQDLRRRGVRSDDIARARAEFSEREHGGEELPMARRVVEQTARRYAALEPRVRRQRLHALLMRRGFERDIIEQALRDGGESSDG